MKFDLNQVVSPSSMGVEPEAVLRFTERMNQLRQCHGFVLTRHNQVIAKSSWHPFHSDEPHALFSVSKSFVSAAVGMLAGEGKLSLDDKIADYFPEYTDAQVSPRMRKVTIRHLLTMSSGHDRCAFAFIDFGGKDWTRQFLTSPLAYKPGSTFVYNSAGTYMAAAIVKKITGENVRDFLMPRLFEPLGIENPVWDCAPNGCNIGGWGLHLSLRDLTAFSLMLLNKGQWDGRQIIPRDYLEEASSFQIDNSMNGHPDWRQGYGFQFWRCRHNAFRCDGASGQYAIVMPDQDMTLTCLSALPDMGWIQNILWEEILPAVHDEPLPGCEKAEKALSERLASLAVPAEYGDTDIHGEDVVYQMLGTYTNIDKIGLSYRDDCVIFTEYSRSGSKTEIPAGLGQWKISKVKYYTESPFNAAARACRNKDGELVIRILSLSCTWDFTCRIRFDGDTITFARDTQILFTSYGSSPHLIQSGVKI